MTVGDLPEVIPAAHPPEHRTLPPGTLPPTGRSVTDTSGWAAPRRRRVQLSSGGRRLLAVVFAAAWLTCPLIEPVPDGPEPDYSLWLLPVDLLALATIVAAVATLWRGSHAAAPVGIAAGVLMCVETALCPGTGHHLMGTFLWVQTGLSLFVLLTSAALPSLGLPVGRRSARR